MKRLSSKLTKAYVLLLSNNSNNIVRRLLIAVDEQAPKIVIAWCIPSKGIDSGPEAHFILIYMFLYFIF